MFGIGFGEFVLVMVVALLVIGPDKLPEIAKSIAKFYNELRRTGNEFKRSVTSVADIDVIDIAGGRFGGGKAGRRRSPVDSVDEKGAAPAEEAAPGERRVAEGSGPDEKGGDARKAREDSAKKPRKTTSRTDDKATRTESGKKPGGDGEAG